MNRHILFPVIVLLAEGWMLFLPQETVTGSTLNGRKEYLNADEGDKDKWEFLNFAQAWNPSERVLPLQGDAGSVKDHVFFTHVSHLEHFRLSTYSV